MSSAAFLGRQRRLSAAHAVLSMIFDAHRQRQLMILDSTDRPNADIPGVAYTVEERAGLAHQIGVAPVRKSLANALLDAASVGPLIRRLVSGTP